MINEDYDRLVKIVNKLVEKLALTYKAKVKIEVRKGIRRHVFSTDGRW
jgi:hypothetical protein